MTIRLTVTVTDPKSGRLIAPLGLRTPHLCPGDFSVAGAAFQLQAEETTGQWVAVIDKKLEPVRIEIGYDPMRADYPEAMFAHRVNRYTQAAKELTVEARSVAQAAGGGMAGLRAIVDYTCQQFTYGHADTAFYADTNEMPQLCSMTVGSCVDINAYLIAALRSAGYDAGYVTGYFIPQERRDHTTDMHCWVVTRCDGVVQEWDIAHHLKMGMRNIQPGLNPKPGVRVPMAHSMGLALPGLGMDGFKLLAQPMWVNGADWPEAAFELDGYEELCAVA